jgi:hypothetical protein
MVLCSFVTGKFVDGVRLLGFFQSLMGGCRGTLGLFELFSSSCSPSSLGSLLPLMLSPSPSSESVKSRDAFATSPSGVSALAIVSPASWKISGSSVEF